MAEELQQIEPAPSYGPGVTDALNQQQPQPDTYTGDPESLSRPAYNQIVSTPTVQQMRRQRISNRLGADPVMDSIHQHHAALEDTEVALQIAHTQNGLLNAARERHDTAGFVTNASGVEVSDPQYEKKMSMLAAQFPFARGVHENLQPQHEARKNFLQAHSELAQYKQAEDTQKEISGHIEKGNLQMSDLSDPNYRTQEGGVNLPALRLLAAQRANVTHQRALSKAEEGEWNLYNKDSKTYTATVLGSPDDVDHAKYRPEIAAKKALFYSALGKMHGAPTSTTPAVTAADIIPK